LQELSNLAGAALKVASEQGVAGAYFQFLFAKPCYRNSWDQLGGKGDRVPSIRVELLPIGLKERRWEDYEEIIWCLIAYPRSSAFVVMFSVSIMRYL